jgi:lysophospholipase
MTPPVLHSVTEGDVPPGGDVCVLRAPDGVDLRVARWPTPTTDVSRGTVLLLHGYTEFIEKYYEVVTELRSRGYGVVTFDWRGQGLSTRLLPNRCKGYVRDYADFIADALLVYDRMVRSELPGPHLLVAHSMGGHLALRFLQEHEGLFERAVLTAPMLGWDQFPLPAARAIASAHVAMGLGKSYTWVRGDPIPNNPRNDVTTDAHRFARNMAFCEKEPDLRLGGPTWRWLQQATTSIGRILRPERLARVEIPVLVASAERDTIVSPSTPHVLPALNPAFTAVSIADAKHEILQESDEIRARFWSAFDAFAR